MLGKINKYGHLILTKNNLTKKQLCKEHSDHIPCNDRCPLFGEVLEVIGDNGTILMYQLSLCEKTLSFNKFIDDRKGVKK